jgi:2-amino-4-hydroxy-6-hydroxymethyldihydropteridine diphosphokinase
MVAGGGVFIALGSNLGDRARHIHDALRELAAAGDIKVLACSSLHETEPVDGPPDAPPFLNAVAEIATGSSREPCCCVCWKSSVGTAANAAPGRFSRPLDLDLLLYHDRCIDEHDLQVPHPRMWQRRFVTDPLSEISDLQRLAARHAPHDSPAEHPCHVPRPASRPEAVA